MNQQKIAILTDSCADIPKEIASARDDLFIVPLKIRCHDGEFADGVNIFAEDIYRRQEAGELPATSLPDGATVEQTLNEIAARGYERVIAIMLSGALSGTYNMIRVQGEERQDLQIRVFDSKNGSLGIGIMVYQTLIDIVTADKQFERLCKWVYEYQVETGRFDLSQIQKAYRERLIADFHQEGARAFFDAVE